MIRQLVGDCRETLMGAGEAIQSVITSPPYYSLRDYGTPPLVWGGDKEHAHEWLDHVREVRQPPTSANSTLHPCPTKSNVIERPHIAIQSGFCRCGAWLGSLGLEPSHELYIEHIVECFRHVRRVLRDDSVLWLNLGDSYNNRAVSRSSSHQAGLGFRSPSIDTSWREHAANGHARLSLTSGGLKEKDLLMIPFRVAMALQADGWWLRSVIPWIKRNAMPESVTDRPTTSIEYVFLLAKSARYYWDAVRVAGGEAHAPGNKSKRFDSPTANSWGVERMNAVWGKSGTRNRRNGDWFMESWQGLMLDEQDDPLALVVNPMPYKESHFATFPPRLVEPMIKASTRPGDTVLDPFSGAGTVGLVADRLGRNAVLCELKSDYGAMAHGRIAGDAPTYAEVAD